TSAPAAPFDPQPPVGRWQGEWRTFSKSGPAILDVLEVKDRRMVGRLYLTGYVAHFTGLTGRETEAAGTVSERDGEVTLALTSVLPPLRLRVAGVRMQGTTASESVPSLVTTLSLEKIR
ncbi:MAG: hypothetical protein HYS77_16885, partial [Candidatus Rokubacteria bacterium]|nr:hypothetical protein [Candidatus Rokubacteria bacterium]